MNKKWQKCLMQILFWMIAEIVLNLLNFDTLGDYSEFLLEQQIVFNCPKIVFYQDLAIAAPGSSNPFEPQLRRHRLTMISV